MQIDRLLEIVLTLSSKKNVTAKELSQQFGVSTRTIYRDIDTLSLAGIPVYSSRGNGGGISLLKGYTLDKSFLSEKEQRDVVVALQSLNAANFPDVETTLNKVSQIFKSSADTNWIEVDFSHWGSSKEEKGKFNALKEAILSKHLVSFEYLNSYGETSNRLAEPLKLIFKGHAWYIHAYCRDKQDLRFFRISRIRDLHLNDESFDREVWNLPSLETEQAVQSNLVNLTLKFSNQVAYRVHDDFTNGMIEYCDDGTFIVKMEYVFDEWVIGYLLSFGGSLEVIAPDFVKVILKQRAEEIIAMYS